jgi:hypothetical protein
VSNEATFIAVEKIQSLSHADVRRLFPRLLGDAQVSWSDTGFIAGWRDGRRLSLVLGTEIERRLGSLRIISTPLRFEFKQWPPAQREGFMLYCDRALQQGGG